jgi:hypothetical protein
MKKIMLSIATLMLVSNLIAQDSVTYKQVDTLHVGNYVIVKKNSVKDSTKKKTITISSGTDDFFDIKIGRLDKSKKLKNVSTNWFIFDLGFTNVNDKTNYTNAQASNYFVSNPSGAKPTASSFNLINGKSSNFNIWFFMQKINLAKHKLNLKWGVGYEMFNFRYEKSLSFRNQPENYIFLDTISFSKNKLYANYLTIPLMLNYCSNPSKKSAFTASAGVSVGYLIGSRNKQISEQRGKQKINGNFDLEPFKVSMVGEIGLGPIRLYGSYALNNMFKSTTSIDQTPFAFGIRFSRF